MAEILYPNSLLFSHYSDTLNPNNTLQLITNPYFMERGPRYNVYAQLRESMLLTKRLTLDEDEPVLQIPRSEFSPAKKKTVRFQGNSKRIEEDEQFLEIPTSEFSPAKKTVRFQGNLQGYSQKQGHSALAQSVLDFSSALRKENCEPVENPVPRYEKSATPPPSLLKREKMYGSGTKLGVGRKSVNSGEKQSGEKLMMMARKSYASIVELKDLSIAAANAIDGENRAPKKTGNVLRKSTVFSTRYY